MGRTNHTPYGQVDNVSKLPSGTFDGEWTAYTVTLHDKDETEIFMDIPSPAGNTAVTVEITEDVIKVFLK